MRRSRFGAVWLVMMRFGVATRLSALDLTALRFAIAGPLLLTMALRSCLVLLLLLGVLDLIEAGRSVGLQGADPSPRDAEADARRRGRANRKKWGPADRFALREFAY